MTLREIFNAIIDHPIEFELHPEIALITIVVWVVVFGFSWWWFYK